MKVLFKIPLALGCVALLLGAAVTAVGRLYVQPSFEAMERRAALRNLDRVTAALMREGHHLETMDRDWSAWDDTFSYVDGGVPRYVQDNLTADSWKQTEVDLMAIYGADRRLRFEGRYDAPSDRVVPEDLFPLTAPAGSPYLRSDARPNDSSGFVRSPRGVYLLASTAVLPTSGLGPVRGTFLMARLIDSQFSAALSEQTSVAAQLLPLEEPARDGPSPAGPALVVQASEIITRAVVRDLWDEPVLLVQVHTPREISAWSARTLDVSLAMIAGLVVLLVVSQYLVLQRSVVRPLGRLEGQVRLQEREERPRDLAPLGERRDEIGSLAAAFHHLNENLYAERRELQDAKARLEVRVEERTTELRRASEDLRLLAKVVECTGDAVLITDLSGCILRVNEAFCRSSGFTEAELLGRNPRMLKSGRHDAAFYASFWTRLTAEGTWQGEIWDRRKSGQLFARWLTVNLVRDEDGNPACYVGVSTDLSRLIAAEDRLRQLNRLYRATSRTNQLIVHEKSRLRLLQEICRIAVEDGGVLMAWVGFADPHTGEVTPAAWFGREDGYLSEIHVSARDVPQGHGPTGTAIRENRHVFVSDIAAESAMEIWRTEALRRGYRSSAAFPLVENEQATGAFMTYAAEPGFFDAPALSLMDDLAADISYALQNIAREEERERLEQQVQQAQRMEAVGRLAGGVAHDFNNILTAIIGYSEMGFTASSERLKDYFHQIRQSARRAASLTMQLLAFSRRQIVRPRRLDLGALVAGMTDMLKRVIGEDVVICTVRPEGLWTIQADSGQLEQVIMNLAVNARDAMPGGGALTIETSNAVLAEEDAARVGAPAGREFVRLTVSDTGHGMDAQTLARIYDPFFTTKEVGKGTGLGLATVYGIVKQSTGYILCQSLVGSGTTFTLYFPRCATEADAAAPVEPRPAVAKPGRETILFVDDDEGVRAISVSVLRAAGYTVVSARDGAECVSLASALPAPPALVVTDMVMPGGLDGVDVARRLRDRSPSLRVLYISGYAENVFRSHDAPRERIELLRKPFTPTELLDAVRRILDGAARALSGPA